MTVLQLEGGPRVRRVDQMGEVGEQCGDTLDYSSQLSFLLFCRFDIGRHYRPIGLLRRVDGDGLIIFDRRIATNNCQAAGATAQGLMLDCRTPLSGGHP